MFVKRALLVAAFGLAGCDGNPFGTGTDTGGGTDTPSTVPTTVKGNLNSASYAEGGSSITVNMTSQDASDLSGTYTRNAAYDVGGYQAFTHQESSSNRYVLALVKQTPGIKAMMAVDGGQFATYHYGGDYVRTTVYTQPTSGLGARYTYSGTYAGLLNVGAVVPGPGGDLDPTRSYRTTGRALITADFTEMKISGGVDQRSIVDTSTALPTISLYDTGIASSGDFAGKVYIGQSAVGDYAGGFGGTNAADIAAIMVFDPYNGSQVREHGLLALTNCADAGGPGCP